MSLTWDDDLDAMQAHVNLMARTPHKWIPDIRFTLDTSGEACRKCGLSENAEIHLRTRCHIDCGCNGTDPGHTCTC